LPDRPAKNLLLMKNRFFAVIDSLIMLARTRGCRTFSSRLEAGSRGFSLIELLVVAALILIMFVMLHGSGARGFQERQKQLCSKNLQSIYVALDIYANEHDGAFPRKANAETAEAALAGLVPQYTSSTTYFICPGSKDAAIPNGESFEKRKISYAYYMGRGRTDTAELLLTDEQVDSLPKIKGRPLFSRDGKGPGNNHHKYGGNLMFGDGRVETVSAIAPYSLVIPPGISLLNPKP
jgi:prepilin-type N-terminal cleavage/methylation domain-containing protein